MKKPISILIVVIICLLVISGCTPGKGEGFTIYLTKDDIPPAQMKVLSHVSLADQPIISIQDIITYNVQTHELKLTAAAFERISQLNVLVQGKSFVVCVDKAPLYGGAFWTPISSIPFDGVTIWKPYNSQRPAVITFELGYPSSSFYGGEDPRNSPAILKSFEQAGKLITKLSITEANELPHSMKGYEIYSWLADGQWHFTLITGTDRNKTLAEIVSKEDFVSEAGWLKVSVEGVDALKAALSKLHPNEFVTWLAGMRESSGQTNVIIQMPPKQTSDTIKEYALQRRLDLQIQAP